MSESSANSTGYTLYTIGYEGCAQDGLLSTLIGNAVQTLLDIRELPLSRKPGFSKTALGNAVARVGVGYEHIRPLGTPRDIRYQRKKDHDETAFQQAYLEHLTHDEDAAAALDALTKRVGEGGEAGLCLFCYEADAEQCHRLLVAAQVQERVREQTGALINIVHLKIA